MNKKKTIVFIALLVLVTALCTVASAERKYGEPAVVSANNALYYFEVYDCDNLYGQYLNRLYFNMDCDNYDVMLSMKCFDQYGMPLQTVDFEPDADYVDVPDCTAVVEISGKDAIGYDTYFYDERINVYSMDGRVKGIYQLQAPVYKYVGWYEPIVVYSEDWESLEISPFRLAEYQKVGWYTEDELLYKQFREQYEECIANKDYELMMDMIDGYLYSLDGTSYAQYLYSARTEVMDLWRNASNSPVGVGYSDIFTDDYGNQEVNIYLYNISYKPIIAFKLTFTCYDVWGESVYSGSTTYYTDDTYLRPGKNDCYIWQAGYRDAVRLDNIRITEVVFDDYSKWNG